MDQLAHPDLAAVGDGELVDQKAEHRIGHAHLAHLGVRGQARLVARHARAALELGDQDAVLDGVGVVPVHVGVLVGDLQCVARLALAGVQVLGQLVERLRVECHGVVNFNWPSVACNLRRQLLF